MASARRTWPVEERAAAWSTRLNGAWKAAIGSLSGRTWQRAPSTSGGSIQSRDSAVTWPPSLSY